jgi:hypothetical protein
VIRPGDASGWDSPWAFWATASPSFGTILRAIPYDAFSVVEDLEYHLHLVMAGERVRYLDEAVISADFPESRAGESVQRSRWEGGRLQTARTWALPLMGKVFLAAGCGCLSLSAISPVCLWPLESSHCCSPFAFHCRGCAGTRRIARDRVGPCADRRMGGPGFFQDFAVAADGAVLYSAQTLDDSSSFARIERQSSVGANRAG